MSCPQSQGQNPVPVRELWDYGCGLSFLTCHKWNNYVYLRDCGEDGTRTWHRALPLHASSHLSKLASFPE